MPRRDAGRALLLSLLLAACVGGATDAALSDSVVIDVTGAKPPSIAIDEHGEKLWSFGGLKDNPDDELQQGGVPGLVALPDGNYLMVEGFRVRVFDRDANELWRFGREGAGPQEFANLGWGCLVSGDTVLVTDQRNRRFALIKPFQGVITTVPMGEQSVTSGACTDGNGYLLGRRQRDSVRTTVELAVGGTDAVLDTAMLSVEYAMENLVGYGWPRYGMVDTLVFIADPNHSVIDLHDRAGQFVRHFLWDTERVPVTDENIPERFGIVPAGESGPQLEQWWNSVRSRPRADNWPAFVGISPDSRGRLWIRESFETGADSAQYLVLDPSVGRVVASVMMPGFSRDRQVRINSYVPDGIVLMHTDDDGAMWMSVIPYPDPL